jgi:hypothetical protein
MKSKLRSLILPVLALIIANFLYFSPVVFQGKAIPQDDIMLGKAKVVQNKVVRVMNTEELIELLKK